MGHLQPGPLDGASKLVNEWKHKDGPFKQGHFVFIALLRKKRGNKKDLLNKKHGSPKVSYSLIAARSK